MRRDVVPLGVVDCQIRAGNRNVGWACYRNVFFVNTKKFEWFVGEYFANPRWIRKVRKNNPRLAMPGWFGGGVIMADSGYCG